MYHKEGCCQGIYFYFYFYWASNIIICSYFDGPDQKNFPEVLFPSKFMQVHPWGEYPGKWEDQCQAGNLKELTNLEVPILELVHVTHNAQAREIRKEFKFRVKQKFGKVLGAYDGRPCGESFMFDPQRGDFIQIRDTEPIFPGFYSWWSIDYSTITDSEGKTLGSAILDETIGLALKGIRVTVPEYLATVPKSRYGNCAFVCNFSDLLAAYAESRGKETSDISIRKGGTLRYKQEICYVLIICIDPDDKTELKDFRLLQPESKPFNMNGLINDGGKVVDLTATPTFHTEYNVAQMSCHREPSAEGRKPIPYSYETSAFAFYFPCESSIMTVGQKCSEKGIFHSSCIRKQPPPELYAKWKCPNEL